MMAVRASEGEDMAVRKNPSARAARLVMAGLLIAASVAGCKRDQPTPQLPEQVEHVPVQNPKPSVAVDPRLKQSFAEATRAEPPVDWSRPPDTTIVGKSVGKLYKEVVAMWDSIPFADSAGKRYEYRATLDTELGPIEIDLRPDLAPNHVRNFVALARAGFYDGLVFERTVHQQSAERPDDTLELIEGGCPLGTGDLARGSLGYWLKPEFNKEAQHESGTVGAAHGEEADTAACKFYITLSKAPYLDGNYTVFGKVTQGLEVARKIFEQPVRIDDEYPDGDRPVKPVVIRKVTIQCTEVDNPAAKAENR
jgi:cyclophilin family peptidyl-prolyl cis-trans isomerase